MIDNTSPYGFTPPSSSFSPPEPMDVEPAAFPDYTEEGNTILSALLNTLVEARSVVDFRDPRRVELQQRSQRLREEFVRHCENENIDLELDTFGDPLIFETINTQALARSEAHRLNEMRQRITRCRPHPQVAQLSNDEVPELFRQCQAELEQTQSIRTKLNYLRSRSGLPSEQLARYEITCEHAGLEGFPVHIRIVDRSNLLMGYSIFDLLFSLQIKTGEYGGEMEYVLSSGDAEKLNTYLTGLVTWVDDFTNIVAELLGPGEDPEQYIELAQRTRHEIMNQPIRMTPRVITALAHLDVPVCLIMGHLSLNLAAHPHRDFIKAKFQELYDREHVLDSEGKPKHFHLDEPYRSNLGLVQLKTICPRLYKLVKFQQILDEFTGKDNLEDALQTLRDWGESRAF